MRIELSFPPRSWVCQPLFELRRPAVAEAAKATSDSDGRPLLIMNPAASQVTFRFDENIDFASVDPAAFFVVNRDGVATFGTAKTASATPTDVVITFPTQAVVEGVGAGVVNNNPGSDQQGVANTDAALDPQGNNNSPDSVGRS